MLRTLCFALGVSIMVGGVSNAEPISLNGSTTVISNLIMPHKAAIEAASGQQIELVGNGSQRGLADLLAGKTQIAMISAPLEDEVKKLVQGETPAIDPHRLVAHLVGETRVAFCVHQTNSVRSLRNSQIADILVGRITNWRDVGGADRSIVVVTAQPGDGVRSMVEIKLLMDRGLTKDARAMTGVLQIAKVVAQLPGALGLVTAKNIDSSIVELRGDEAITQPLILVTIGEGSAQVRRVIEAVTQEGRS
jgi:phosphate transport system substrate-binding protein